MAESELRLTKEDLAKRGERAARSASPSPAITRDYLVEHLGRRSRVARAAIGSLRGALAAERTNDEVRRSFEKWRTVFGRIYGYDLRSAGPNLRGLADHYGLDPDDDAALLLFAVHTYFSVVVNSMSHGLVPEDDTFAWYLSARNPDIHALSEIAVALEGLELHPIGDGAESRDTIKSLYQNLVPRRLRHDLGEYYTPDWLAELVLDEVGYDGNPDVRLLDPACGSGTFLVAAINRSRRWYDEHRHGCGYDEKIFAQKITANVAGFDVNPLAVMMAKANCAMALGRLSRHVSHRDLPVRLFDTIIGEATTEPFDFIVGNPPWVNWESLPADYRERTKPIWDEYGLFTLSGTAGRLGGGKKDISMLLFYRAVDRYLDTGGRLGFVMTQSLFKTKGAGDGFRRLAFERKGEKFVARPIVAHDMSSIRTFGGATSRSAILVCEKTTGSFTYPVPYIMWRGPTSVDERESLDRVRDTTTRMHMKAFPVDPGQSSSPWLTVDERALPAIRKLLGRNDYRAHAGAYTGGLNGCFWIRIVDTLDNGDFLIENLHDIGRVKVQRVRTAVESDLIHPLLRGRDLARWHAEPSIHLILTQDPGTRTGIPEAEMGRRFPKTYDYLRHFEQPLRGRSSSSVRSLMERGAFYSMFSVGDYTMAPWKVAWRYIAKSFTCSVIPPCEPLPLPDHRLIFIGLDDQREAYFLAGLLNSSPVVLLISSYVVGTQIGPHSVSVLNLPRFSEHDASHLALARLSRACHDAAQGGNVQALAAIEAEIDRTAAALWGISDSELDAVRSAGGLSTLEACKASTARVAESGRGATR